MAMILQKIVKPEGAITNYVMIPRVVIKLLEIDIGIMADWIERSGYGADMNKLRIIQDELNIVPTSLEKWLKYKLKIERETRTSVGRQSKISQMVLQCDK